MKKVLSFKGLKFSATEEAIILACISILAGFIFYLPFILHTPSFRGIPFNNQGLEAIYGMWDGPLYVTVAKTLWDPNPDNPLYGLISGSSPVDLTVRYPSYPLMIKLVSLIGISYWTSGLLINLFVSTGVTVMLYFFLRRFGHKNLAFWVSLALIFLPPRAFMYRYTLMSEPLFILGVLGAIYFFKQQKYYLGGLLGSIAVAARPNGFMVIIGFAFVCFFIFLELLKRKEKLLHLVAGFSLMPLTLAAIYAWHHIRFGNWLVSFTASDFQKPRDELFPFLRYFMIGEEGTSYVVVLSIVGILELMRRRQWGIAFFCWVFMLPVLSIGTDINRFLLPIVPFVYGLAGEKILGSRPMRWALLMSLPLIYTYAWSTMIFYRAPFEQLWSLIP